jgi:Tfp pilus assembly protein PilF
MGSFYPLERQYTSLAVVMARSAACSSASRREAVRLRPDSDVMRVSLGMALAASGDVTGGAARLQEALKLNPDNRDAKAGLTALGTSGVW